MTWAMGSGVAGGLSWPLPVLFGAGAGSWAVEGLAHHRTKASRTTATAEPAAMTVRRMRNLLGRGVLSAPVATGEPDGSESSGANVSRYGEHIQNDPPTL